MAKRQQHDLSNAIQRISDQLDPSVIDTDPTTSLSTKLRRAQKALKVAKREADKLRQQHLEKLLNEAIAANHAKRSQALKYLIRAERNRQCYARFCHHTKPKAAGGLAFVTVPDPEGNPQPLFERDELEATLLEHSRVHFSAAEGSKFTREPLNRLLQYDGMTSFGDRVFHGKPFETAYNFDKPTAAILRNLRNKLPPSDDTSHPIDYELLMNGIKKWPERTATSPSGRHLGIYKTLQKHVVRQKKNEKNTHEDPETTTMERPLKQGRDILFLIFDIMTLALRHTYPLQ